MSRAGERTGYRFLGNADERFKLEGRSRLGWSTLTACAVHILVFFALPSWRGHARIFDSPALQGAVEWIVLTFPLLDDPAESEAASGGDAGGDAVIVEIDSEQADALHALAGEA